MKAISIRGMALTWGALHRMEFGVIGALMMEIDMPLRQALGFIRPHLERAIFDDAS